MLRYPQIQCPYCGEMLSVVVDCSSEVQNYYEDCQVCCRPMAINVTCSYDGELQSIDVCSDSDATSF